MTAVINTTGNELPAVPQAALYEAVPTPAAELPEQAEGAGLLPIAGSELAPYLDPEVIARENAAYRAVRRAVVLQGVAVRRREAAQRLGSRTAILSGSVGMAATASALAAAYKARLAD